LPRGSGAPRSGRRERSSFSLTWGHQRLEDRAHDLLALKELTRILRDLAAFEDASSRAEPHRRGGLEHEQAVAVEGRAVVISRTRQR
jgi:hypothetical protein